MNHKGAIDPHLIWEVIAGFEKKIANHSFTNSNTSIVCSKVGKCHLLQDSESQIAIDAHLIWEEIARFEIKCTTHYFTNSTTSIVRSKVGKCHLLHDSESQMRNRSPLNVKSFFGMIIINPWGGSWELSTLNSFCCWMYVRSEQKQLWSVRLEFCCLLKAIHDFWLTKFSLLFDADVSGISLKISCKK